MLLQICILILASSKSVYDMTDSEFKSMLMHKPTTQEESNIPIKTYMADGDLPINYDSRTLYQNCIHPVRNQLHCGSCWAFGISEVLSDRYCIGSSGQIDVVLSPQMLVSCDTKDSGCGGGDAWPGFNFAISHGLVRDQCLPYTSGDNGTNGVCPADGTCIDTKISPQLFKCKPNSLVSFNTTNDIKQAMLNYGVLYCEFDVYSDFKSYKSGIYYQTTKDLLGQHAVKLIGWGKQNGINYWNFQNSWGNTWGENGFFRIKIGEARICAFSWVCDPDLTVVNMEDK